jgi:hypothetical protein
MHEPQSNIDYASVSAYTDADKVSDRLMSHGGIGAEEERHEGIVF